MNSDQSEDLIKELCESGRIDDVLEEYILACSEKEARAENADALSDENSKRQKKQLLYLRNRNKNRWKRIYFTTRRLL